VKRVELVVGLTGTIACGKETVASTLQQEGFGHFSLSDAVRDEARRRGRANSRIALQDIGNELRELEGGAVLARRTFDAIEAAGMSRAVVDGIRNPKEVEYLRSRATFFLIGVDAAQETRFHRLRSRARPGDPETWADFVRADSRDRGGGEAAAGQQVDRCLKMADFLIRSDGPVEDVQREAKTILAKIRLMGTP